MDDINDSGYSELRVMDKMKNSGHELKALNVMNNRGL